MRNVICNNEILKKLQFLKKFTPIFVPIKMVIFSLTWFVRPSMVIFPLTWVVRPSSPGGRCNSIGATGLAL